VYFYFCFQQGASSTSSGELPIAVIGGAVGVVVIVVIIIVVILVVICMRKKSHLVSSVHVISNNVSKGKHFTLVYLNVATVYTI